MKNESIKILKKASEAKSSVERLGALAGEVDGLNVYCRKFR